MHKLANMSGTASKPVPLSGLLTLIRFHLEERFASEHYWIRAEITDVKRYYDRSWCFLKFIEKRGAEVSAEMKGVFWRNTFGEISRFEKLSRQEFRNGIEVVCLVAVKFHEKFGLSLEVLEIDTGFALGQMELQRQETLDRLVSENPGRIVVRDGVYHSFNQSLPAPGPISHIALIAATNSDGHRDFMQELNNNPHAYRFQVDEYPTQVQGISAAAQMFGHLNDIASSAKNYDVIVIVRGGGSQTDFSPFDDYTLARTVALSETPVFTGIGHDRNISIVDMMARSFKTPTKVAAEIVQQNFLFEQELFNWKDRLFEMVNERLLTECEELSDYKERLEPAVMQNLKSAGIELLQWKRLVKNLDPVNIVQKGFAMIRINEKVITSTAETELGQVLEVRMKDGRLDAKIIKKQSDERKDEL